MIEAGNNVYDDILGSGVGGVAGLTTTSSQTFVQGKGCLAAHHLSNTMCLAGYKRQADSRRPRRPGSTRLTLSPALYVQCAASAAEKLAQPHVPTILIGGWPISIRVTTVALLQRELASTMHTRWCAIRFLFNRLGSNLMFDWIHCLPSS
jgi:hypothetical protein